MESSTDDPQPQGTSSYAKDIVRMAKEKPTSLVAAENAAGRKLCNDPHYKEEFLAWLQIRVESIGYGGDEPPEHLRQAVTTGDPKDLPVMIWREWSQYCNPPGPNDIRGTEIGPRGGTYTIGVTKDGRAYRRYF